MKRATLLLALCVPTSSAALLGRQTRLQQSRDEARAGELTSAAAGGASAYWFGGQLYHTTYPPGLAYRPIRQRMLQGNQRLALALAGAAAGAAAARAALESDGPVGDAVQPVGRLRGNSFLASAQAYTDLLLMEIDAIPEREAERTRAAGGLRTLYFGGGTPSLVEPAHIRRLLDGVRGAVGVAAGAEVTIECDPGTFDAGKLAAYVAAGVTRVSLGVQSFDDGVLEAAGRAHRRADARPGAAQRGEPPLQEIALTALHPNAPLGLGQATRGAAHGAEL